MKKYQTILILTLWGALAMWAWFIPSKQISEAERRPLAQKPVFSEKFQTEFESYSLDQFPLRDGLRTLKSLFHTFVLGQEDNNGIYLTNGIAVKQEYPLNTDSVHHAIARFQTIYDKYLAESRCFYAIVPDKGY